MIQNLSFLANTMYHFNYTRMSESGTFKTPQAKWIKYPWTTFKVYCNTKKVDDKFALFALKIVLIFPRY